MNRKYLIPAGVFLSLFIIILVSGLSLNTLVHVFSNGDVIDADYNGSVGALAGFRRQDADGGYDIDLQGRCDPSGLALISLFYAPEAVYVNGMETEFNTYGSISGRIMAAEIPERAFVYGDNGVWSIRIELRGITGDQLSHMSLCGMEAAERTIAVYNILMPMIYGMLLAITAYGFLLYQSKRDTMLLLFSLYTLCLFLWCFTPCLINHFGMDGAFIRFIHDNTFEFAVVLGIVTCISFCEFRPKGGWKWFGKWYGLLGVCAAFSIISNNLSQRAGEVLLFAVYMAGIGLLIVACGRAERKPWIALCGLSITQALRFIALLYSTPLYRMSFYFELMKLMRLFTLPYVFCCMIFINSTFAGKFREAEELARELEQSNKLLDEKVEERTAELIQQQQLKTNLLTNIFHDLRSPLLILRGCTDRLKNKRYYDEETVQILDDRLSFITEMTEELFAAVKLEDKTMLLETEPVPLKPMLRKIVDACRVEASKKDVGIECTCQANAVAWGDELWLSRAFQNLLSNAVYYSRPGKGSVSVTMQTDAGKIVVRVSDHGVGIAPEDIDKIFDRYNRVSGTKKHKSSGLGLSIAASVIAHHDGAITVESRVGEGTTFQVVLPLWSTAPDEAEPDEAAGACPESVPGL